MSIKVPFVDLKTQWDPYKNIIIKKIENLVDNTAFIGGKEITTFEEKFAEYIGTKYTIGVSSGTSAIEIALRALNIGPGDEVIVPANTFIATAFAVSATGAKPVFCDVDKSTWTMTSHTIAPKVTRKTKAVIAVHLFGNPVDMLSIYAVMGGLDNKNGIYLIEDACQAHGAEYFAKKVGNWSHIAAFSHYPTKNLGCWGDGGSIVTNSDSMSIFAKAYRDQGQTGKSFHQYKGHNHRLDPIQAAVLNVGLDHLDEWNEKRIETAEFYKEHISFMNSCYSLPEKKNCNKAVYHLFPIYVKNRKADELVDYLNGKGISTSKHYSLPIHKTPAYFSEERLSVVEDIMANSITLPMHPFITQEQREYVVGCLKQFTKDVM